MRWARLILWLSVPAYAGVAILFLIAPEWAASLVDLELGSATADNDVRSVYGGLGLGLAVFFGVAARRDAWVPPALALLIITMSGLALARLLSWLIVGFPSGLALGLHAAEIVGIIAGVAGWRALRRSGANAASQEVRVREFRPGDYPEVRALWERSPGIGLNESDSAESTRQFLAQNAGLSRVAVGDAGAIVGAVLCGHDGRRGYLHHLAVDEAHRGSGVAGALLDDCIATLRDRGIAKCNVFVFGDNAAGAEFWSANGWLARPDLSIHQRPL